MIPAGTPLHTSSFFEPWLEKAPGWSRFFLFFFRQVQAVIISTGFVFHKGNLVGFRCVETSDNILTQHFKIAMELWKVWCLSCIFLETWQMRQVFHTQRKKMNTGCLIKYSTNKLNYLTINPSILISSKQASFWKIRSQQVCHLVSQAGSSSFLSSWA